MAMNNHAPLYGNELDPCFACALKEATKNEDIDINDIHFKHDYCTLSEAKRKLAQTFPSSLRYKYFKKDERFLLKEFHFKGKFIILTLGHFSYVEDLVNYTFFNNLNDEVVAYWEII